MNEPSVYSVLTERPYRAWVAAPWENAPLTDFTKNIKPYTESAERAVLLDSRNRVVKGEVNDARGGTVDIVIKQFRKLKAYDTARFTVIRSKALRSFLNALKLQEAGILTPEPVLCVEKRDGAILMESYYVCRYIDYDFSLRGAFAGKGILSLESLLNALAGNIKKIHDAGILFGDLNGANILIQMHGGKPLFYFIDLNRMKLRGRKKMTDAAKAFELSWLEIPAESESFFLQAYTGRKASRIHDAYSFALKYRRRVDNLKKWRRLWCR